jgi:hypothetical protein
MKQLWFKKWGWVFRPINIVGWIITILVIIFCAHVFFAVDRHSHSVSDTLYGIFPYFVCSLVILYWVADNTSRR